MVFSRDCGGKVSAMLNRKVPSPLNFSLVVVLCLSLACQVVGVPSALYDFADSQEVVEFSLHEDAAPVSEFDFSMPKVSHEAKILSSASPHVSSTLSSIFHPPISSL